MKVGDRVRVLKVPPWAEDDPEFLTRTILAKSLGRIFPVAEVDQWGMIGIGFGEVVGREHDEVMIWIEPNCLERVEGTS
jgi:hypothetical protein